MIGDELRVALRESPNPVFEKLNQLEKQYKALAGLEHDSIPGYRKWEHIKNGTSFPDTASDGEVFIRTDLDMLMCTYDADNARWLTAQEYERYVAETTVSATTSSADFWIGDTYDIYYTKFEVRTFVATTNDGTHFWDVKVFRINLADTAGEISAIVTSGDSADTYVDNGETPDNQTSGDKGGVYFRAIKNNSPGNLTYSAAIRYRFIIT